MEQFNQAPVALSTPDNILKLGDSIAYRVGNTNTTGSILSAGTYVYVSGHSTIAEGLRKVTSSIGTGASITTSNTSAITGGIGNELFSKTGTLENVSFTAKSGVTATSSIKKRCGVVNGYIQTSAITVTTGTENEVGTVDAKPVEEQWLPLFNASNATFAGMIRIYTTGKVCIYPSQNISIFRLNLNYMT